MARIAIPTIEEAPAKSQPIPQNYMKVPGLVQIRLNQFG
jgi:hypothetical protein